MTRTQAISGTVLAVAACAKTDALLEQPGVQAAGLAVERVADPDEAIARVERGDIVDVVLLAPGLPDPVRVAQRLHSLDRDGAVVVLSDPEGEADLRHALAVAPFLAGDVSMTVTTSDAELVEQLAAAATRTRARREAAAKNERRETPPPLSARYLGTLLDSVPIGLVTLDAQGGVIGWNKRTGDMLGVPEVEVLGRSFADLFAASERRGLVGLIDRLGTSGIDEEGQIFTRGGRSFEITGARFAIRSGEGGALLILQDVTKRERAEHELRLQKALSDAQADTSQAGIVVTTLTGEFARANRRFAEIWGVAAEEMRADKPAARQRLLDQVESPELFLRAVDELTASGREYQDTVTLKDGRVIERYATHVRDDAGEVVGQIWFHTDVTARMRREDSLRFLADATNMLSSSLDYETTLRRIAELAVPKIADWCSVEIAGKGGRKTMAIAHIDDATLAEADVVALARNEEHLRLLGELELESVMTVPIKVRERVFGAINFIRTHPGHGYNEEDLALAEELARRAAIAIDNSLVHAELRDTARTLQESLLPPHLPAVTGLELAARFRPAGMGTQVGGDFYDIFEMAGDRWGIAVGDVCGKGAQAAALTALTRYTVRAAAMYESDAAGVLGVLNQALLRQRGDFRFTTLAFCIVDMAATPRRLHAATGGHPRPLLMRSDGTTEAVGAAGPLLGVLPEAEFRHEAVELEQGDVIVLYTDGLADALAPERMLDEADLLRALGDCHGRSAGQISQHLEHVALGDDPAKIARDDIALLVAKLS